MTISLPLLAKELTEQANRPRTYWIRASCCVVLVMALSTPLYHALSSSHHGAYDLASRAGVGDELCRLLLLWLWWGILLLFPAMMAGVVAREYETGVIPLLIMTGLSPWAILLEKYLSRLIPICSILLLSLPIFGVIYTMGGLSMPTVAAGLLGILAVTILLGAIAILCSVLCRNTALATCVAYASTVALLGMIGWAPPVLPLSAYGWLAGVTVALLWTAQYALMPCALRPPLRLGQRLMANIDAAFTKFNTYLAGGVTLGQRRHFQDGRAVAWREQHSRILYRPHYLLRCAVLFLLLWGAVCLNPIDGALAANPYSLGDSLVLFGNMSYLVLVMIVAVLAASGIAKERYSQSMDILLTTPLHEKDIVAQKLRPLRFAALVLGIPLLLNNIVYCTWRLNSLAMAAAITALMAAHLWFAMWLGSFVALLATRRAVLWTLVTLALLSTPGFWTLWKGWSFQFYFYDYSNYISAQFTNYANYTLSCLWSGGLLRSYCLGTHARHSLMRRTALPIWSYPVHVIALAVLPAAIHIYWLVSNQMWF